MSMWSALYPFETHRAVVIELHAAAARDRLAATARSGAATREAATREAATVEAATVEAATVEAVAGETVAGRHRRLGRLSSLRRLRAG